MQQRQLEQQRKLAQLQPTGEDGRREQILSEVGDLRRMVYPDTARGSPASHAAQSGMDSVWTDFTPAESFYLNQL